MGSLLAARLTAAGADVTVLGRPSAHLELIQDPGLTLIELDGSSRRIEIAATADPAVARDADLVVVVVKTWATGAALSPIRDLLPAKAVILTLQNGLGNAATIRHALAPQVGVPPLILTGVTTQAALREEPGMVRHTGSGLTAIGREGATEDERATEVAACLTLAGWPAHPVVDIDRWVWRKLAINAAINPLTALAGVPNRAIANEPDLAAAAAALAGEVAAVAAARGLDLGDALSAVTEVARATGGNRSSMLCDLEEGIPTEIDAINGAVVVEAASHGVAVPANQVALALVRAREQRST
jgi:2-dehydropantoate 2-reductase